MKHATGYRRSLCAALVGRLREPRRFLQVLAGPRQSGKTTLARQAIGEVRFPAHYASADEPTLRDRRWIEEQWEIGRERAREGGRRGGLLVLDEIQKVPGWSESAKRFWDEDSAAKTALKVVLLGSSPLLVQRGLTESLAGRFEILRVPHWSFAEMREAFGFDLDRYLYFGGYPGAAPLAGDRERWSRYVLDSLVETTVSRDILLLTRVDKPALLRRLFQLGCDHSGEVLSYQKMLGQLHDAGNTTTLAHYLELLSGAGMLAGLSKFSGRKVRQRASSPKLQVLNTALMTAASPLGFDEARADRAFWGRLVESAVGAHLSNGLDGTSVELLYWRERNHEVDFVLRAGKTVTAIEVKSGRRKETLPGLDAFARTFRPRRILLVGAGGIPLEEFLLKPPKSWMEA
ncbi:MAG TPA: ATP-binding protein [Planctomycetota bacterium]|nr:ATP-binding protein [Planctomycetota bacterium]